jgi:hypothetical protein
MALLIYRTEPVTCTSKTIIFIAFVARLGVIRDPVKYIFWLYNQIKLINNKSM